MDIFFLIVMVIGLFADIIGISQYAEENYIDLIDKIKKWGDRSGKRSSRMSPQQPDESSDAESPQAPGEERASSKFESELRLIFDGLNQSDQERLKTDLVRWINPIIKRYSRIPEIDYPYGFFLNLLILRLVWLKTTHKIFNTRRLLLDKKYLPPDEASSIYLPTFTSSFPQNYPDQVFWSRYGFYWKVKRPRNIVSNWEIIKSNLFKKNASKIIFSTYDIDFPNWEFVEDVTDKENRVRFASKDHVHVYNVGFTRDSMIFEGMRGKYILNLDFDLFSTGLTALVIDFLKAGRVAIQEEKKINDNFMALFHPITGKK